MRENICKLHNWQSTIIRNIFKKFNNNKTNDSVHKQAGDMNSKFSENELQMGNWHMKTFSG